MSFLNDDFGHFGGPEWEGGPPPPICPVCGEHHGPNDRCPLEEILPDEEYDPGPEPEWVANTPDMPVEFLGEVTLEYDPLAFTYRHVVFRSPN